jgi:hypothetical protein
VARTLLPFLVACATVGPASAWCQTPIPPLITDRPDQTESAAIVPRGAVQVELGGTHVFEGTGSGTSTRLVNLGGTLVRVGLFDPLELRVGLVGWQHVSDDLGTAQGFGDLNVGAKVGIREGAGLSPSIAVLGAVLVPIGAEAFRAAGVDPFVKVSVSHELGDAWGLGYNAGVVRVTETLGDGTDDVVTDLVYTVSLARSLGERVGAFVEGFGLFATADGRDGWHALDGGITFALRPNVQLDVSGGVGLTGAADDWFVGGGVAFRVPR